MLWQQQQKERKCYKQETSQVDGISFFLSFFLLDDAIAEMDR